MCISSDFMFHFCPLYATLVHVHPSSLYFNSHCMFQPNWPSSGVQVVVLKESALLHFYCTCLGLYFYVGIVLSPCYTLNQIKINKLRQLYFNIHHSDPVVASHLLQTNLLEIQHWLKRWRMKINETKSTRHLHYAACNLPTG
jgi:hypothetical protein